MANWSISLSVTSQRFPTIVGLQVENGSQQLALANVGSVASILTIPPLNSAWQSPLVQIPRDPLAFHCCSLSEVQQRTGRVCERRDPARIVLHHCDQSTCNVGNVRNMVEQAARVKPQTHINTSDSVKSVFISLSVGGFPTTPFQDSRANSCSNRCCVFVRSPPGFKTYEDFVASIA